MPGAGRKRYRFDLDEAPDVMRDAESEGLADFFSAPRADGRVRHEAPGLHDQPHVGFRNRHAAGLRAPWKLTAFAVEGVTVRIGKNLHGLAALDRVRSDQFRDAARKLHR